jgi:hypothetical protein
MRLLARIPTRMLIALAAAGLVAVSAPQTVGAAPLTLPSSAPPELVTLLGRMGALNVETERFSLSTSVEFPAHSRIPRELRKLFSLFNISVAGEARGSSEGSFSLSFLGARFRVIIVAGHTYVDLGPRLARHDGGRPWIDTGRAGLGALFGSHGGGAPPTIDSAPSFQHLVELLTSPIAVTPLGLTTIEGQPVSGFRETVSRALFKRSQVGSSVFAQAHTAVAPEIATVETFIAASGLPIRTRILEGERQVTAIVELDFPAINFPLTVQAPPPAQTIALAALKRLDHRHRHKRKHG